MVIFHSYVNVYHFGYLSGIKYVARGKPSFSSMIPPATSIDFGDFPSAVSWLWNGSIPKRERERDIGTWTVVICDGISEYPEKIYSNFQLYDILFKLAKLYTNIHDIQNLCQRMSSGIIPNRDGSSFYAWPRAPQHVWSLPFFSLQLHISNNIHVYIYIYRHITSSVYIYNVWTYTYIYIYLFNLRLFTMLSVSSQSSMHWGWPVVLEDIP